MEKQTKPAPDAAAHLAALRCARASLLLASLRWPRAPPPTQDLRCSSSSSSFSSADAAGCALRPEGLLHRGEVAAARREAAGHARIAGSELLLVLAVAPAVLLLLLLLGLL
ncbi:hypothetical protein SEVIR_9G269600v4 [Setaria viridis]|uniref:Uncharacterized protein n=1 Tax=Setaria viridis TaxID=4556 RepID=A0A4U6SY50_SETVI|nr:uncharacterized protein LOC105913584 [Setaria italica]XP_034577569.1 uncharacterized protein LOC117841104 [Setaria viridis]TKV94067.1 hypothetical protein SEVIR_9G269600v2 [Setaria viridis]